MKKNWKQIVLFLALGLVLGLAIGRWSVFHCGYHGKKFDGKRFERKFDLMCKKLDLEGPQREKIRSLLKEKHEKIKAIKEEHRPKMRALKEAAMAEIRTHLTDEQKEKFAEMEARWKKKWEKRKSHRHW